MIEFTSIPLIDIGGLRQGNRDELRSVARQIRDACTNIGFFYVINHGIAQNIFDSTLETALEFFRLPEEEKKKTAANSNNRGFNALGKALMDGASYPDYKEFFQIGLDLPATDRDVMAGQPLRGPNIWPEKPVRFRPEMSRYFEEIGSVGSDILRGVSVSLDLPEDFFAERYAKPLQRTQVVYYPAQPASMDAEQYGVAPHSDFGCITLLYQDSTGGLEVKNLAGDWVAATPVAGSLVVNVGDLLERWSNKRFASTKHRVVNRSGRERMSIATFYDPSFSAVVDPRDLGLGDEEQPMFEPTTAGDHIAGRIQRSFGYGL